MKIFLFIWFFVTTFVVSGLTSGNSFPSVTGIASYYGDEFVGRKTASGEIYRHEYLTAAHRSLPFGTRVLITNLDNQKQVLVTINDRGPFIKGRIIDLSKSAAEKVGMIVVGTANVRLQIIPFDKQFQFDQMSQETSLRKEDVFIQVGAFRSQANGRVLAELLKKEGFHPRIKGDKVWRVFLKAIDDGEAKKLLEDLSRYGHQNLLQLQKEPSGEEIF